MIRKIFKIIFLVIPFFSFLVLYDSSLYVLFWKIAYYILLIIMFSRPLRDIFPKLLKFLNKIVLIRKELWIIVWTFAIAHWIWFFIDTDSWVSMIIQWSFWTIDSFLVWWVVAFFVSIPLLFTSNKFSLIKLWKYWKKLQYLAYVMFITTILHIYLIWWKSLIFWLVLIWVYLFVLVLSAVLNKRKIKKSTSIKYVCEPCSWIYDEELWDPDWWIPPWTKFEDIPNDWVCPVCWVWKQYFKKLDSWYKKHYIVANVKDIKLLNENNDVVELSIESKAKLPKIKRGQFLTLEMKDKNWVFSRSYSVSWVDWNIVYFLVKIIDNWRAWEMLKNMKIWDEIKFSWPFWNFVLKETKNNKVFIATWTWLAPIFYMLKWLNVDEKKNLIFGSRNNQDLFYIDELLKIPNLIVNVFLSQENDLKENESWVFYNKGRLNIDCLWDINKDSEFYICWNPWMVNSIVDTLNSKWFKNIYYEKF